MALQVRRGTNAERLGITPSEGELIYTTDTKQIYVGDGTTAGGNASIAGTIDSLLADSTPQLGGTLDLNNNDITGTGNITITGNIQATGNINLGDGVGSDVLNLGAEISGNIIPNTDGAHDIGSVTKYWNEAWINQLNVNSQITAERIQADLIANDSTLAYDRTTGAFIGTSASFGNITSSGTITATGTVTATSLDGDLSGSVFGDDSTLLVDGVNGKIVGPVDTTTAVRIDGATLGNGAPVLRTFGFADPTIGRNAGSQMLINTARNDGANKPAVVQAGDTLLDIAAMGYDGNSYKAAMVIKMGVDKNVTVSDENVPGRIILASYDNTGNFSVANCLIWTSTGKLSVGAGDTPEAKLDIGGDTLLGRLTTTQRDALTAVNGMILYNSTDNKFQGYENGAWVNLI
tara:strand:+ start:250 stop:1464 length:1215 start_codon:yes stop_codon:yes gene_type:complete